jgi:choline dehydrogenase-like flavoprotein
VPEGTTRFDADVVVVGSGFGGSVAALRFCEAGQRVVVLGRGPWVRRGDFEADADMFWSPRRHRFGMNELRPRGRHVIPWVGSGVGGGSHVYAATLKRRAFFDDFPVTLDQAEMDAWYAVGGCSAARFARVALAGSLRAGKMPSPPRATAPNSTDFGGLRRRTLRQAGCTAAANPCEIVSGCPR